MVSRHSSRKLPSLTSSKTDVSPTAPVPAPESIPNPALGLTTFFNLNTFSSVYTLIQHWAMSSRRTSRRLQRTSWKIERFWFVGVDEGLSRVERYNREVAAEAAEGCSVRGENYQSQSRSRPKRVDIVKTHLFERPLSRYSPDQTPCLSSSRPHRSDPPAGSRPIAATISDYAPSAVMSTKGVDSDIQSGSSFNQHLLQPRYLLSSAQTDEVRKPVDDHAFHLLDHHVLGPSHRG